MSELLFNTVFREVSCMLKGEAFSTMYFGRHCGKSVVILQHDLTVLVVFAESQKLSAPELIKTVSFRGEQKKGVKIVGNENIILLLDECGHIWRLINAFEVTQEENACLHSLREDCFYQWIPFKKFNFVKVLALTAMNHGFACLGICGNLRKKLVFLPSLDAPLEEFNCEELNSSSSLNYYLLNLNINVQNLWKSFTEDSLLVTDRLSGKTYLCGKGNERYSVINVSDNYLISVLHLQQKSCLLLSFESGKLIFHFYNSVKKQCDLYLSRKIALIEQCCCSDTCLLWSDGITLQHSKLNFCDENFVKVSHLKLNCSLQSPVSLIKIHHSVLIVTINNFYYCVTSGLESSKEAIKRPPEILFDISKGCIHVGKLEEEIELLAHYLCWKDIVEKDKGKLQVQWKGNNLNIKSNLGISLKEEIWRLKVSTSECNKTFVHLIDLEGHLSKGMCITVENPFKIKCQLKLGLVGNFREENLFLDLGEVEEHESNIEKKTLIETLEKILQKRKKLYVKGTSLRK